MATTSRFWKDHQQKMQDPAYAVGFLLEQEKVATVDRIINQLDEVRGLRSLPKTQLARIIGAGDAAIRRLFSQRGAANPTFDTVVKMAASLGYEVTLTPMEPAKAQEMAAAIAAGRDLTPRQRTLQGA